MERIGDEIRRELSRSGGGQALALADITAAWPRAVGETVARQAWPLRLARDGTLHVATSSATWAFELDRLAGDVGERLAAELEAPAPPRIRFRVGPVPEPGAAGTVSTTSPADAPEVPSDVAAAADAAASAIEDPELRRLVAQAARTSLARARSGRAF
jgi:hypothetical protein